jgi:hypothetical protein
VKLFLAAVLCTLFCLPLAAEEAKALADISEAKTACLVNRGTDLGTVDGVRDKLQQWGRWKLVPRPEDADLLLIISDQEITAGSVSTASGFVTGSGRYASGSSMGFGIPLVFPKVFLSVVDRRSGDIFTFVSVVRRRHISGAPAYLVATLKGQLDKHEHRDEHQDEPRASASDR